MDTACSSALTAVHAACEHIRSGRGDMALAGGVTVIITPGGFIGFSQAGMLSPDGRCAAFDASASGFVRGEGAGMVMLKRLSKAIEDGDPIQGIIIGTALNQDGHTNGIMLPSSEAQARLVADTCREAGVDPNAVGYVEAHGTGTAVGDPLEAHALSTALQGPSDRRPAGDRFGQDEPRAFGNRRRGRRVDEGDARAPARTDSRQSALQRGESAHRLRRVEAARRHEDGAVPCHGRRADGRGHFLRLRRARKMPCAPPPPGSARGWRSIPTSTAARRCCPT